MNLEHARLKIYNKLIKEFTGKNIVIYNRSGEFYKINKPKYAIGRDYGDGWIFGDNFHTHLHYNFSTNDCSIYFHSLGGDKTTGSTAFHSFIETIDKNCGDLIFIEEARKRNLLDFLYNNSEIFFENIEIDNNLLLDLNKKFKENKGIKFINCSIVPSTDFCILQGMDISFSGMKINEFNIFSNTNNNYRFKRCDISINKSTKLNSEKLTLINNKIDFNILFLTSLADKLKVLEIANTDEEDKNDNYRYLPDFAPNLEVISLDGKVNSMYFLARLKNLQIIDLKGFYNCFGMSSPLVSDIKELERLEEKNKDDVEIQKIIRGYKETEKLQNHTTCSLEVSRLLRICELYNRLSFTKDDEMNFKNIFNKYNVLPNYVNSKDFLKLDKGYYEVLNYKLQLVYESLINPNRIIMPDENKFIIEKQFLGTYNCFSPIIKGKGILVLYIDGRPIVFSGSNGIIIDTKEKAMEFFKKYTNQEKVVDEDGSDYFINAAIEEIFNTENYPKDNNGEFIECDFVDYMDLCISEKASVNPLNHTFNKPFLARLKEQYGDQISGFYKCFDLYNTKEKTENTIVEKNRMLLAKAFELVIKSNSRLNKEELLFLYKTINNFAILNNKEDRLYDTDFILRILKHFDITVPLDDLSIEQLNKTCNNDLVPLTSQLEQNKSEWKQYLNNRQIKLPSDAIKQLTLAKPFIPLK